MRLSLKRTKELAIRAWAWLSPKRVHIIEKRRGESTLFLSPEFDAFLRKNRKVLAPTLELVTNHENELRNGQSIRANGVMAQKAATGGYKGRHLTLKVCADGKEFFVKILEHKEAKTVIEELKKADWQLRKRRYKAKGFNVRVIKPHLLYSSSSLGKNFLITDFYNEGDVIQCVELPFSQQTVEIYAAIEEIGRELDKIGLTDVVAKNAFFQPKTKTILIFDVAA